MLTFPRFEENQLFTVEFASSVLTSVFLCRPYYCHVCSGNSLHRFSLRLENHAEPPQLPMLTWATVAFAGALPTISNNYRNCSNILHLALSTGKMS